MQQETATFSVRMDKALKQDAESLFSSLGLNMTTAINAFAIQAVRQGKIPFELAVDKPNPETLAAMQEVNEKIGGKRDSDPKSVETLFKELNIHVEG